MVFRASRWRLGAKIFGGVVGRGDGEVSRDVESIAAACQAQGWLTYFANLIRTSPYRIALFFFLVG